MNRNILILMVLLIVSCKKESTVDSTTNLKLSSVKLIDFFFNDTSESIGVYQNNQLKSVQLRRKSGVLDGDIEINNDSEKIEAKYLYTNDTFYNDGRIWMKNSTVNRIKNTGNTTWGKLFNDNHFYYNNHKEIDSVLTYKNEVELSGLFYNFTYNNGNLISFTEKRLNFEGNLFDQFEINIGYEEGDIDNRNINTSILNYHILKNRGLFSTPDLVSRILYFNESIDGLKSKQLLKTLTVKNLESGHIEINNKINYTKDIQGRISSMIILQDNKNSNQIILTYR